MKSCVGKVSRYDEPLLNGSAETIKVQKKREKKREKEKKKKN